MAWIVLNRELRLFTKFFYDLGFILCLPTVKTFPNFATQVTLLLLRWKFTRLHTTFLRFKTLLPILEKLHFFWVCEEQVTDKQTNSFVFDSSPSKKLKNKNNNRKEKHQSTVIHRLLFLSVTVSQILLNHAHNLMNYSVIEPYKNCSSIAIISKFSWCFS